MEKIVKKAIQDSGSDQSQLHWEVVKALTLTSAEQWMGPNHTSQEFFKDIEYQGLSPQQAELNIPNEHRVFFQEIPLRLKHRFLFFSGANFMWENGLLLSEESLYQERSKARPFSKLARTHLPQTIKFIESLPFKQLGQIEIFGIHPFQPVYWHSDDPEGDFSSDNIIVSFQPPPFSRKVTMQTAKGDICYPPASAYCIDDRFLHRVEPVPYFTYSIKIDGIFKDGIRDQAIHHTKF